MAHLRAESALSIDEVQIVTRSYLSLNFLYTAHHFAERARALEVAHPPMSPHDPRHRGYVVGSVVMSTTFLEAVINEVLQDAADNAAQYAKQLPAKFAARLSAVWRASDQGKKFSTLERYAVSLSLADANEMPKGEKPWQDAQLVVQLRNWMVHYRPQDRSTDSESKLETALRDKFPSNPVMSSGNPWLPNHA